MHQQDRHHRIVTNIIGLGFGHIQIRRCITINLDWTWSINKFCIVDQENSIKVTVVEMRDTVCMLRTDNFSCLRHVGRIEGILDVLAASLCRVVRSETNDSKLLKFGLDDEVLPISMNRVAFIILDEDECVETTDELLIALT